MFIVKPTLLNTDTGESFSEEDDVIITFENGSVIIGFIGDVDLSDDLIEMNVPFVDDYVKISTNDIKTITKIKQKVVDK